MIVLRPKSQNDVILEVKLTITNTRGKLFSQTQKVRKLEEIDEFLVEMRKLVKYVLIEVEVLKEGQK